MRNHDYGAATEFLAALFGDTTEHQVEIRALPNERGTGPSRSLFTRDPADIEAHCTVWDGPGRAVYFGAATRRKGTHSGTRADVAEITALWTDCDTYKHNLDKEDVVAKIRTMAMPPTSIVDSGGGLQFWWVLREAIDVSADAPNAAETEDAIIDALKRLAGITAGDLGVCDLARIMRLPGTHNTKTGELRPVRVLWFSDTRYEFDDLVEILDWHRPVIDVPTPTPDPATSGETNPFLEAAKRFGFKTPLDVEQRLAAMNYLGDGDTGIHQTQLHVSASLVTQGMDDDAIVELLIEATKHAVGVAGANWNWKREERNLRKMIATARTKFAREPDPKATEAPDAAESSNEEKATGTNGGGARIIDLTKARETRDRPAGKSEKKKELLIPKVGDAIIACWERERGPLISVAGELATYSEMAGHWTIFDGVLTHALRVMVQEAVVAAVIEPTGSRVSSVYRYIVEHPRLHRENVAWNSSGLIICRNGAIDPATGAICPRRPDLYATWAIDVDYDPNAQAPRFVQFLRDALGPIDAAEAARAIETVLEHMGASLISGKRRDLRKAMLFIGKSHTGKSRMANIYRALKGGVARCVGMKVNDLDDLFGMSPLLHADAWIADDAVRQGDRIDAERFKVIVTGEPMSVRVPGGKYVEVELDIPVVLTANNLPRVHDDSEAVYNRSLIFPMNRVWPEGKQIIGDSREIDEIIIQDEFAGVLNLAVAGWKRLSARGRYDPPLCMTSALEEYKESNNPVGTWLKLSVEVDKAYKVHREDLRASYNGWYMQEYGADAKLVGSRKLFSVIRKILPEVEEHHNDVDRFLCGIRLTDAGVSFYKFFADQNFGRKIGSGQTDTGLNQPHATKVKPTGRREPRF